MIGVFEAAAASAYANYWATLGEHSQVRGRVRSIFSEALDDQRNAREARIAQEREATLREARIGTLLLIALVLAAVNVLAQ